jgi:hypothetical protein
VDLHMRCRTLVAFAAGLGGRTDGEISRRTDIPALGQGSASLAIACWTKLEITPPSISNPSRYGTRSAGTSVSRSPKIRHEDIVLMHVSEILAYMD